VYGNALVKGKDTKEPLPEEESERILKNFVSAKMYENGLYCRADDRGDPVIQLSPPLTVGQKEFDEMEQIIRGVLQEAWTMF
ncbi:aspartate aminotransferase family protein, partial [Mycobacterium tuberculosis]|nr:aspartate aminotransferase family protein [Mycobacterium tuberculosis]